MDEPLPDSKQRSAYTRSLIRLVDGLRIFSQHVANRDWGCDWESFDEFSEDIQACSRPLKIKPPFSVRKLYGLADPAKLEAIQLEKICTPHGLGRALETYTESDWRSLLASFVIDPEVYERKIKSVFFRSEWPPNGLPRRVNGPSELLAVCADDDGTLSEVTSPDAIQRNIAPKMEAWRGFFEDLLREQENQEQEARFLKAGSEMGSRGQENSEPNSDLDNDTLLVLEHDYTSVVLRGKSYQLSEDEAKVLECLCCEPAMAPVRDSTLLTDAGRSGRLRDVFKSGKEVNPVFGEVIIPLQRDGKAKNGWRELAAKRISRKTRKSQD